MQQTVIKLIITLRFFHFTRDPSSDTPEIAPIKTKKIGQINRRKMLAPSADNDTFTAGAITPDWNTIMVASTRESMRGKEFMSLGIKCGLYEVFEVTAGASVASRSTCFTDLLNDKGKYSLVSSRFKKIWTQTKATGSKKMKEYYFSLQRKEKPH